MDRDLSDIRRDYDGPRLIEAEAGHDPLVLRRYPAAAPGLDGIAVRVDRPEQADA